MRQHKRLATVTGAAATAHRSASRRLHSSPSQKTALESGDDRLVTLLATYRRCHAANGLTRLMNFVCAPTLLWCIMVWCAHLSEDTSVMLAPNGGLLVLAACAVYYFSLDAVAGGMWSLCVGVPLWIAASWFQSAVEGAWMWSAVVFLLGWTARTYIAHDALEWRQLSSPEAAFQCIVLASLFVWYDVMMAFGLCRGIQSRLDQRLRTRS